MRVFYGNSQTATPNCFERNTADARKRNHRCVGCLSNVFDWLKADAFDENGAPIHQRGLSVEPDIYFLGLPWQSRRGSSFIWGVWHDAKHLADHIHTQRKYLEYHKLTLEKQSHNA